jgi:putative DNA primase/helicase
MRDAVVADYRRIQKKLVARFLGDPKCVNESRVFRLPGFNHCKGEPVPVACVKFDPELRYAQAELEAALPNITVSEDAPASKSAKPPRNLLCGAHGEQQCVFMAAQSDSRAALDVHFGLPPFGSLPESRNAGSGTAVNHADRVSAATEG